MPTGLLELSGTMDLAQFWPAGTSDADTTKILVTVGDGAFRYRPHPGAPFSVTHVFDGAKVKGKTTKPVVDAKGRVTIRLQGIDAPELHFMPQGAVKPKDRTKEQDRVFKEWNFDYRQHLGETATVALQKRLGAIGGTTLSCIVRTAIDHPNDAFDTYGRLIGDIAVKDAAQELNANEWLLENGWALPTFYNSLSREEISHLFAIGRASAKAKKGVWKLLKKGIEAFAWDLRFPGKGGALDPNDGHPPLIMPKLFRRQATFEVNRRAKMVSGTFEKYLADRPDRCYLRKDFLDQGPTASPPHRLDEFVKGGKFLVSPDDLVFREEASMLIIPGGGTPNW